MGSIRNQFACRCRWNTAIPAAAFLFLTVSFPVLAQSRIDYSTKPTDSLRLPSTDSKSKDELVPNHLKPQTSLAPIIAPMVPNSPVPSAERLKQLEMLIDKSKNWMFSDPEEMKGKTKASEIFGVRENEFEDDGDKKSVERFLDRSAGEREQDAKDRSTDPDDRDKNGKNRSSAERDREIMQLQGMLPGIGRPDAPFRNPGAMGPFFSDALNSPFDARPGPQAGSLGFMGGGMFGTTPLPLPSFDQQRRGIDTILKGTPLGQLAPGAPYAVDSTMREINPVSGRPAASSMNPGSRLAGSEQPGRFGLPPALGVGSPLDALSPRQSGSSSLSPSFAAPSPAITAPNRPPTLDFPVRGF